MINSEYTKRVYRRALLRYMQTIKLINQLTAGSKKMIGFNVRITDYTEKLFQILGTTA